MILITQKLSNLRKYINLRLLSIASMENHIDEVHEKQIFKCDKCDGKFLSVWRLTKHGKTHLANTVTRNCHYFNSHKSCPYEKLGCKFNHIFSRSCKFGNQCTIKMCQFKH